MNPQITALLTVLGGIAGFLAYRAYELTQLKSGLIVLFIISWFLFSIAGFHSIWKLLALFKNPFMAALMIAGLGFTYWTFQGNPFPDASVFGFGSLFLGAAFAIWIVTYWAI